MSHQIGILFEGVTLISTMLLLKPNCEFYVNDNCLVPQCK